MSAPTWAAVGAIVAALLTGTFTLLSATRANRPAESNAQLAWVKAAQDEAKEARVEAKEAREEARAARTDVLAASQRADQLMTQASDLQREFAGMQDWVDRVMRAANMLQHDMEEQGRQIEDSGVLRLMRAINGGPHLDPK